MLTYFILGWIASGVLAYGISVAYWSRNWERMGMNREDWISSILMGVLGYTGLVLAFILSRFAKHGLKFY